MRVHGRQLFPNSVRQEKATREGKRGVDVTNDTVPEFDKVTQNFGNWVLREDQKLDEPVHDK